MTVGKFRSFLYALARILGDIQAIRHGRIGQRIGRRVTGRITGRLLGRLELVSKIPQHDFHAAESDHPQEIIDGVLVARDQAAKHLQPGEQALDGPASPVAA